MPQKLSQNDQNLLQKFSIQNDLKLKNNLETKIQELEAGLWTKIKTTEQLNPYKMTTIDSWQLQKTLSQMHKNGCEAVVVEISSQGLEQNRHIGLGRFDITGFLNISPEHIEAHGGFDNYLNCKKKLFQNLNPKGTAIVNKGEYSDQMLDAAPRSSKKLIIVNGFNYLVSPYSYDIFKNIEINDKKIATKMIADFEVENAYFASKVVSEVTNSEIDQSLLSKDFFTLPGRMEWVVCGGVML